MARRKGSRNRNSAPVLAKAQELGIDPWEILLYFAAGDWKALGYEAEKIQHINQYGVKEEYTIDPAVRAKCAAEASQYLYPKRRALEIKEESERERPLRSLTNEQLAKLGKIEE
jgi:hypothetical protein